MKSASTKKTRAPAAGPTYLTKGDATELIDKVVRDATQQLSRSLEVHLQDIDKRIRKLEGR
jgi:hypothetical protein